MTTEQLKEIAPEWVVANGIIRPVNSIPKPTKKAYGQLTTKGISIGEIMHNKRKAYGSYLSIYQFASDLKPGIYKASELVVIPQVLYKNGWTDADPKVYARFANIDDFADYNRPFETRIKITQ